MDLSDGFLMNENCVWNVQTSSRDTFYLSVAYCQKSLFHVFFPLTFAMEMCVSCHLLAFIQLNVECWFSAKLVLNSRIWSPIRSLEESDNEH